MAINLTSHINKVTANQATVEALCHEKAKVKICSLRKGVEGLIELNSPKLKSVD